MAYKELLSPSSKSSTQSPPSHQSRSKERIRDHALLNPHPRPRRPGRYRIRMQQLQRLPWPTGLLLYVPVLSLYLPFPTHHSFSSYFLVTSLHFAQSLLLVLFPSLERDVR
jgi:hypothetical protein